MAMTRRRFVQSLGASAVLLPFLQQAAGAQSAGAPQKRILIITSLGTMPDVWRPSSAPGQPLQLSTAMQPLAAIKDSVLFLDGLSFATNPSEGHSSPQTLTGLGNGNMGQGLVTSVDQYIARQVSAGSKIPVFLLGAQAKNESQFFYKDQRQTPIDSPSDAFQLAFGAGGGTTSTGVALPRKSIMDLVSAQVKDLQTKLGSEARARLDQHLDSVSALEKNLTPGSGAVPAAPNLGGADPEADSSTCQMGELNLGVIVSAFASNITQIAGLQWGISNRQFLSDPTVNADEHSGVHSGSQGVASVTAAETYLAKQFLSVVNKLKGTPDPSGVGSLYDNTLILWTRDIGNGPVHSQFSMPYVVAGGSYLKTNANGVYLNFGGNDANFPSSPGVLGQPHERLLLNLCDFMGVTNLASFGNPAQSNKTFLSEIKA